MGLRNAGPSTIPAGPTEAGTFPSPRKPSYLVESGEVGADRLKGEAREGKPEEGPSHAGSHPYLGALAALPICRGFSHPPTPLRLVSLQFLGESVLMFSILQTRHSKALYWKGTFHQVQWSWAPRVLPFFLPPRPAAIGF